MENKTVEPSWTCRYGNVSCAIFPREITKGKDTFTVKNVVIHRTYKDENEVWQKTDSYRHTDLYDLIKCASKAYEEVRSTVKWQS